MAELKDYGIGALTATILLMLGFAVMPDDTHFSRDLGISKYCDRLSGTEKTCYPFAGTRLGSKYSSSGWEEISKGVVAMPQSLGSGTVEWKCTPGSACVQV